MKADWSKRLAEPFPPETVHWRVARVNEEKAEASVLAYLDARDVMDRLDEALGPDHWQCRYVQHGQTTICEIGANVNGWVWKADGAGATQFEAEKGALSDAFKRAAVRWGVGRYLYGLGNTRAKVAKFGKNWYIDKAEYPKLRRSLLALFNEDDRREVAREKADDAAADAVGKYQQKFEGPALIPVPDIEDRDRMWRTWASQMQKAMQGAKAPEEVEQWWEKNEIPLSNLKKESEKAYDFLHNVMENMKAALNEEAGLTPMDAG